MVCKISARLHIIFWAHIYTMDDISSISSTLSTVSFRGEETDVGTYIDSVFADIQQGVNDLHSTTRALSFAEDRGDSYDEAKVIYDQIADLVKDGCALFREVATVNKQFLPAKPRAPKKASDN